MRAIQRIRVTGTCAAADRLRAHLADVGYTLVADDSAGFSVSLTTGDALRLDSVDSPLEQAIERNLEELDGRFDCGAYVKVRAGGVRDPKAAALTVPDAHAEGVALAVFRAIEQAGAVPEPAEAIPVAPEPANPAPVVTPAITVVADAGVRHWLIVLALIVGLLLGLALPGHAQDLPTSPCYVAATASTNATNCRASAGVVTSILAVNTTSTIYYLRLYNLSTPPTCSSATGYVYSIPIPHASGNGAGVAHPLPGPEAFSAGIGFCITGGASSTDNTNAAVGVFVKINHRRS